jgi:tyrosinase
VSLTKILSRFAFYGSFQIFIFIGDFCQDPDEWSKDPYLAGIDIIFASDPMSGGCGNCERQAESSLLVTDVVPLTAHLIKWIKSGKKIPQHDPKALACKSLEANDVMPFLYKNMHWRVATVRLTPMSHH